MHGSFKSRRLSELFKNRGIGPGGWYCHCCAPAPSKRKQWVRNSKKSLRRFIDKEIARELE